MRLQVVNAYLQKMDEGRVPYIKCGNDVDHTRPFVRLDSNDEPELYCLACHWTMSLGTIAYDEMKKCLSVFDVRWLDED
jgi:hypothetical protein